MSRRGQARRRTREQWMMNAEYIESLEIAAPADQVWSLISDVQHLPDVLSGMTALTVEGADPTLRVGMAWTQTRVIAGRSGAERLAVTEAEHGHRYVTEGGSHGIRYVSSWTVEDVGPNRSRLTCRFTGIPRTAVARLLVRLFAPLGARPTREAMQADLRDIAAAAMSRP